jgi:hypothetical protein
VLRGGLRFVRPYYFDYYAYVKTRWVGASLLDLFTREFTGRPRSYYEAALRAGRLRVEDTSMSARESRGERGARASAGGGGAAAAADGGAGADAGPFRDAPLLSGQRVRHYVHRHEPPVRQRAATRAHMSRVSPRAAWHCAADAASARRRCWRRPSPSSPSLTPPWPSASPRPCQCTRRRVRRVHAAALLHAVALTRAPRRAGPVPQEQRDGHPGQRGARAPPQRAPGQRQHLR